ncbi:MAG: hypothetical protein EB145_00895, partial [Proteobacteria bacterium]|nr:hypothetical protein [Pseudomonadota bacterium]
SLTHKWVFDLKENDIFWCTADVGWVTGHSYIVYGPLANGATCVLFEGTPDYPDKDRFWSMIAKHKVTIFYTAPTAIRSFMRWGDEFPARHDMSSLRLIGTVGEPINPEAWIWYHQTIGGSRCPIVDTWWQTETGGIMISPIASLTTTKPGSATFPFPGIDADIVDEQGNSVPLGGGGSGQAIAAFVTVRSGFVADDALAQELRAHVAKAIGPIARPKVLRFTAELPKTRSGKIMRRLLRDVAEGRVTGDTTTLTDPNVLAEIRSQYEATEG